MWSSDSTSRGAHSLHEREHLEDELGDFLEDIGMYHNLEALEENGVRTIDDLEMLSSDRLQSFGILPGNAVYIARYLEQNSRGAEETFTMAAKPNARKKPSKPKKTTDLKKPIKLKKSTNHNKDDYNSRELYPYLTDYQRQCLSRARSSGKLKLKTLEDDEFFDEDDDRTSFGFTDTRERRRGMKPQSIFEESNEFEMQHAIKKEELFESKTNKINRRYYTPKPNEEYTFVKKLGEGKCGAVYLAKGPGNKIFAVKGQFTDNDAELQKYKEELEAWKSIQDLPFIPKLYEESIKIVDNKAVYVAIMEKAEGMDLEELCDKFAGRRDWGKLAKTIAKLLVDVVSALHARQVFHFDLKCNNIMIDYDDQTDAIRGLKVVDFGQATTASAASRRGLEQRCRVGYYVCADRSLQGKLDANNDWMALAMDILCMFCGPTFVEFYSNRIVELFSQTREGLNSQKRAWDETHPAITSPEVTHVVDVFMKRAISGHGDLQNNDKRELHQRIEKFPDYIFPVVSSKINRVDFDKRFSRIESKIDKLLKHLNIQS